MRLTPGAPLLLRRRRSAIPLLRGGRAACVSLLELACQPHRILGGCCDRAVCTGVQAAAKGV